MNVQLHFYDIVPLRTLAQTWISGRQKVTFSVLTASKGFAIFGQVDYRNSMRDLF